MGLPSVLGLQTVGVVGALCLALGAAGGGRLAWVHQDGKVQRAQIERDGWRRAADDYKAAAKGWSQMFHKAEGLRGEEARAAVGAVNSANAACSERVAAARASAAALKGLMAQPVTIAKGCPVPGIWTAKDLQPVLRPEAR